MSTAPPIRRVGIVFSGGPAPGANAVIAATATAFIDAGVEVYGFFHGYTNLQAYDADNAPLVEDTHYRVFREVDLRGLRNTQGIIIGTARANPCKGLKDASDLRDPVKVARLERVYQGLKALHIDALVSIGGDDTLKTANYLHEYQQQLGDAAQRVRIVHVPKTIDNDYRGIDFTFGFFTAVEVMARELQNLRADAQATSAYFIVETMGRKAGWLAYAVAIAGEAHLVLGVEDAQHMLMQSADDGQSHLDINTLVDRIVDTILAREAQGKFSGTVVLAEGIAELLPATHLSQADVDDHGHLALGRLDIGKLIAQLVSARYEARSGQRKKIRGVQLGYEARCAPPNAFDVILGSQLGVGAFRALFHEALDAHMVSTEGQLDLCYVPFSELIDPHTMLTETRFVELDSDFYKLVRFLEARNEGLKSWRPGARRESD